MACVNHWN